MNKFLSLPITLIKQLVQSNSVPKDWVVQQVAQREQHYPASELVYSTRTALFQVRASFTPREQHYPESELALLKVALNTIKPNQTKQTYIL
jgi:hypothetical protein